MTSLTTFLKVGLSIWLERMSRHWTMGRPALIIVANWRVNTPRSRVVMRFLKPKLKLISFGFVRIVVMTILRLRRLLMSSCLLSVANSPDRISPVGVRPFHRYVVVAIALPPCRYFAPRDAYAPARSPSICWSSAGSELHTIASSSVIVRFA